MNNDEAQFNTLQKQNGHLHEINYIHLPTLLSSTAEFGSSSSTSFMVCLINHVV